MKGNGNGRGENGKSARSSGNENGKKSYEKSSKSESVSGNENERGSGNERRRNDEKWRGERWNGKGCWFNSNGNRRQPLWRIQWYETGLP